MNAVLILAGGSGTRFGSGSPKQLVPVHGKPLLAHVLATYRDLELIDRRVLVVRPDVIDETRRQLREHGFEHAATIVAGGETRQLSIRRGIARLQDDAALDDGDLVVLQNAASPNTRADLIARCIAATREAEVVQAFVPALHTVIRVEDGFVGAVLPRSSLGYTCDPTVYRAGALRRTLARQQEHGLVGDATIDIARSLDIAIKLVRSDRDNIKVTTPADLDAVRRAMGAS